MNNTGSSYISTDDFFQSVQPQQLSQYSGHTQDTTGCLFIPEPLQYRTKVNTVESLPCFISCSKDNTIRLWSRSTTTSSSNNYCLCEYVQSDAEGFTAITLLNSTTNNNDTNDTFTYPKIVGVTNNGNIYTYQIVYKQDQQKFELQLLART